jgi:UDP-N-acetylglucosamine 2-epimerase
MLDQVLEIFGIRADIDLDLMSTQQSLPDLTARVLQSVNDVLVTQEPDIVFVQGDTTTTFTVALAAFYHRIPVAHVEAGLRTYDRYAPFPEEMNRTLTSSLAQLHFAPTSRARDALLQEGITTESIHIVGNTVVDALLSILPRARELGLRAYPRLGQLLDRHRTVLITGHRRENFGDGFKRICRAIRRLAEINPEVQFVYPVHLNPNVQRPVGDMLSGRKNLHLIEPLTYLDFVWLLNSCFFVLTDSGGIQEEAPSLGKPILVMRDTTERPESVEAGVARLVGTDEERIVSEAQRLLTDQQAYRSMSTPENPYGDGTSAKKIVDILERLDIKDLRTA